MHLLGLLGKARAIHIVASVLLLLSSLQYSLGENARQDAFINYSEGRKRIYLAPRHRHAKPYQVQFVTLGHKRSAQAYVAFGAMTLQSAGLKESWIPYLWPRSRWCQHTARLDSLPFQACFFPIFHGIYRTSVEEYKRFVCMQHCLLRPLVVVHGFTRRFEYPNSFPILCSPQQTKYQ